MADITISEKEIKVNKATSHVELTLECKVEANASGTLIFYKGTGLKLGQVAIEELRQKPSLIVADPTAELGKIETYYAIYNKERIEIASFIALLEDAYLLEVDKSMRIRYNPEVTGLKRNYIDVITPTLGRETPFIRRAGAQKYRTFTLGGLISIEAETEEEAPINNRSLLTSADKELLDKIDNMQLSSYDARAIKEKIYRERILEFLEDGKPKLFKSLQEGNIWIYLSAVTLTADKTSARNLYSFSCTATEIAERYVEDYGLIKEES